MPHLYDQGLRSQEHEIVVDALPVRGTVPAWLDGVLVRNGPGKFEVGEQRLKHWFDGFAMLHRFTFDHGRVGYANKFVESPHFKHVREHGTIRYSEFATDPCRSIFKRLATVFSARPPEYGINASVSVSKIADHFVAWTETPIPLEFDPRTLDTIGVIDFGDDFQAATTTPHPHLDPHTGDAINSSIYFARETAYKLYRIPADGGARREIIKLPVAEPAYMHSFSLTDNYIVLAEYPLVVNPLKLITSGKPFADNLVWRPERGTTFIVVRKNNGAIVGRFRCGAFFCFHHVNAWEQADQIVVDLLAYPDGSVIRNMYLDALLDAPSDRAPIPATELRRYTIDLLSGTVGYDVLGDEPLELPRINDARCHTQPYQYVYGIGLRRDRPNDFTNQLVKIDTRDRSAAVWYDEDCYPGEPVFVPSPAAQTEDDGIILSVVLDARQHTSFLVILDARSFGEIARAEVPQHIPFGFHGAYFGDGA